MLKPFYIVRVSGGSVVNSHGGLKSVIEIHKRIDFVELERIAVLQRQRKIQFFH